MRSFFILSIIAFTSMSLAQKVHQSFENIKGQVNWINETREVIEKGIAQNKSSKEIIFKEGKVSRVISHKKIKTQEKYEYKGGKLIKYQSLDKEGKPKSIINYEYTGDKIKKISIDSPKYKILKEEIYTYDKENNLVEVHMNKINSDSSTKIKTLYSYANQGKTVTKKSFTNEEKEPSAVVVSKLNEKGQVIEESTKNSLVNYTYQFGYDDKGHLIRTKSKDSEEIQEFTYDDKGNWIKKVIYYKEKPKDKTVYERKIYYKK